MPESKEVLDEFARNGAGMPKDRSEREDYVKVIRKIRSALERDNPFNFGNYVGLSTIQGKGWSCDEASQDRAVWLLNTLPQGWYVDIFRFGTRLHTLNIIYRKYSDGSTYVCYVDGYGAPVTYGLIENIGPHTTLPAGPVNTLWGKIYKAEGPYSIGNTPILSDARTTRKPLFRDGYMRV